MAAASFAFTKEGQGVGSPWFGLGLDHHPETRWQPVCRPQPWRLSLRAAVILRCVGRPRRLGTIPLVPTGETEAQRDSRTCQMLHGCKKWGLSHSLNRYCVPTVCQC